MYVWWKRTRNHKLLEIKDLKDADLQKEGCLATFYSRYLQISSSAPREKAMESSICGGRGNEISEHFFDIIICSKLKIYVAGLDLQKKGFPAICCIPNHTDSSVA